MNRELKTRDELRVLYQELRYCSSGYIMHDCLPIKNVAEMDGMLARIRELCTPQMVLCLLDDAGLVVTKITDGKFTLAVPSVPKTRRPKNKKRKAANDGIQKP